MGMSRHGLVALTSLIPGLFPVSPGLSHARLRLQAAPARRYQAGAAPVAAA